MRQVGIDQLLKELRNHKSINSIRKEAQEACETIDSVLKEIGKIAERFLKGNIEAEWREDSTMAAADNFGNQIIRLVETCKMPALITYNDLVDYTEALKRLQVQMLYVGARWIRKFDKSFKRKVLELEIRMKQIQHLTSALERDVHEEFRLLKTFDSLLKDIENLRNLLSQIKNLEESAHKIENEIRSLKEGEDATARNLQKLAETESLQMISELDRRIEKLNQEILSLFAPLEKPIEKCVRILKTKEDPSALQREMLTNCLSSPIEALHKDQRGHPQLRSALNTLRGMLLQGKLELKESRVHNALKSISEICDKDTLENLWQEYLQLTTKKNQTLSSEDVKQLIARCRDYERQISDLRDRISGLKKESERIKAGLDGTLKSVQKVKEDAEAKTRDVFGEKIEITLSP